MFDYPGRSAGGVADHSLLPFDVQTLVANAVLASQDLDVRGLGLQLLAVDLGADVLVSADPAHVHHLAVRDLHEVQEEFGCLQGVHVPLLLTDLEATLLVLRRLGLQCRRIHPRLLDAVHHLLGELLDYADLLDLSVQDLYDRPVNTDPDLHHRHLDNVVVPVRRTLSLLKDFLAWKPEPVQVDLLLLRQLDSPVNQVPALSEELGDSLLVGPNFYQTRRRY